jgi:bifunctional non-homologous end joining protein LigD
VEPRLVGEVAFTERITDGSMRHPTWRILRTDTDSGQVRLDPA